MEKFRQIDKSESLVKEVMEEEWNMLRKDTDLCLTPEYKRYNLFCNEPEVCIIISTYLPILQSLAIYTIPDIVFQQLYFFTQKF